VTIPHWLIGLAIFVVFGGFIVVAFRQAERVKPDRNKNHDDWTRQTGGRNITVTSFAERRGWPGQARHDAVKA
jgi:hypothetical protein